jgi:hypothetical protein
MENNLSNQIHSVEQTPVNISSVEVKNSPDGTMISLFTTDKGNFAIKIIGVEVTFHTIHEDGTLNSIANNGSMIRPYQIGVPEHILNTLKKWSAQASNYYFGVQAKRGEYKSQYEERSKKAEERFITIAKETASEAEELRLLLEKHRIN